MVPIVAGLLMGAAMGGGIAALQGKDVLKGALMGGVGGALGGVLMPAVAGATGSVAGGAATGEALATTAGALGNVSGTELINQGILSTAGNLTPTGAAQFMGSSGGFQALPGMTDGVTGAISGQIPVPVPPTPASTGLPTPSITGLFDRDRGSSGGIGNFLTQNKGALMGGVAGGMMAPGQEPDQPSEGNIRDYTFSQERNPLFGQPGQSAFTNQRFTAGAVTPVEDYKMANGGIIALAEGGGLETQRYERPVRQMAPEVAAYNAKLMERANQQYNVNLPPAPNQVPGSVGYIPPPAPTAPAASTDDSISGLTFNPVTQQFEGKFKAPGSKGGSSMFDGGMDEDKYAELDARYMQQQPNEVSTGEKNGGRITQRYNEGGLSSLGSYSDGGQLLKGPGDGVSDSIPARIGARQPARLADGEFVVPARIVSEIGNGSTDAGAKQLYAMMDRVQKNRKKTVGKGKVAVDAKSRKLLPA
jgi:hypothetical protein